MTETYGRDLGQRRRAIQKTDGRRFDEKAVLVSQVCKRTYLTIILDWSRKYGEITKK